MSATLAFLRSYGFDILVGTGAVAALVLGYIALRNTGLYGFVLFLEGSFIGGVIAHVVTHNSSFAQGRTVGRRGM